MQRIRGWFIARNIVSDRTHEFHLEGLRADSLPIPPASSRVDYVEVAA
jgi:hypothetical protein